MRWLIVSILAVLSACPALHAAEEEKVADAKPLDAKPVEPAPVVTKTEPVKAEAPLAKLDFSVLEALAVQDGGRKKPLQTYAIETIELITGRFVFASKPHFEDPRHLDDPAKDPKKLQRMEPMDILLSMMLGTRNWEEEPIVLVAYGPLKKELGLNMERKRFSLLELKGTGTFWKLYSAGVEKQRAGKAGELTDLEQEAQVVAQRVSMMQKIMRGGNVDIVPHPTESLGTWLSIYHFIGLYMQPDKVIEDLAKDRYDGKMRQAELVVGPYLEHYKTAQAETVRQAFQEMRQAYMDRKPDTFFTASQSFKSALASLSPKIYPTDEALKREVTFNNTRPFGKAWLLYLIATILGLFLLRSNNVVLKYMVWGLTIAGFAYHIYGFVARCLIAGRPPVSNMYESVIWVGFGAVLFGIIFELIYKVRYFIVSGMAGGFICLVLMDQIPVWSGNTAIKGFESRIDPLVPVLRDNFWLTVHVLTITLSYAAFALAWVLGHITLFQHLIRPSQTREHQERHQFIYRILQVGVLLLASGTILGGVWAYYSWGRFWGWDSKETWAFIALMCYLVVLHGRFTGWWSDFAFAVGSVVCFQAVVMAWYGVNFILGSGLHAYGAGSASNTPIYVALGLDLVFTLAAIAQHLVNGKPEPAEVLVLENTQATQSTDA